MLVGAVVNEADEWVVLEMAVPHTEKMGSGSALVFILPLLGGPPRGKFLLPDFIFYHLCAHFATSRLPSEMLLSSTRPSPQKRLFARTRL